MIKLSIYAVTIFQSEIQEWHRSGNGFESNRPETQYLPFKVLIYRPAEDAPSAAFAFAAAACQLPSLVTILKGLGGAYGGGGLGN